MRQESMNWWKSLPYVTKDEYADLMYQRHPDSLTGREIENIYRVIELDEDI